MWGIDKEVWNYMLLGITSFLGSMLGIGSGNIKLKGEGKPKMLSWIVAIGSSMLFAFVGYEVLCELLEGKHKLCIALSGAIAWFGADWIRIKIDAFVSKKIDNVGKDFNDYEGADYENQDK